MASTVDESTYDVSILDFHARVVGPRHLVHQLSTLFPSVPSLDRRPPGDVSTTIRLCADTPRPGQFRVLRDGQMLVSTEREDELLALLEWAVISAAVECLGNHYLLLHAGAVARAGRGILLSAASGSGKTTLVAGLLASGFQYLSDEVAVLELASWRMVPFARSLCVKEGARQVLLPLYPQLATDVPGRRFGNESVWYLMPPSDAWPTEAIPIRYVILPKYVSNAETALIPVSRLEALAQILEQSFNLRAQGAGGVGGVVEVLRRAECYTLTIGDLQRAVALLCELVDDSSTSHGTSPR